MQKVVLDRFGAPWGWVDTDEKEIVVAGAVTIDGAPVNARTRKVSSAKRYREYLDKWGAEYFSRREHNGQIFYVY